MIFFEHKFTDDSEKFIQFSAIEDGEIAGVCVLSLNENHAEIKDIDYVEKKEYIVEGLIKSAFNFAANRNYYMARCNIRKIEKLLIRMNFVLTEKGYENDIPTILAGSCSYCRN